MQTKRIQPFGNFCGLVLTTGFSRRALLLPAARSPCGAARRTRGLDQRTHSSLSGHDEPVVWVRQEFVPDLSDTFLEMRKQGMRATIAETGGCEVLAELDRQPPDKTVVKKRYSAFFETDLDAT